MTVDIDETWRNDEPGYVQTQISWMVRQIADRDNAIGLNADIGNYRFLVETVEYQSANENDVNALLHRVRLFGTSEQENGDRNKAKAAQRCQVKCNHSLKNPRSAADRYPRTTKRGAEAPLLLL